MFQIYSQLVINGVRVGNPEIILSPLGFQWLSLKDRYTFSQILFSDFYDVNSNPSIEYCGYLDYIGISNEFGRYVPSERSIYKNSAYRYSNYVPSSESSLFTGFGSNHISSYDGIMIDCYFVDKDDLGQNLGFEFYYKDGNNYKLVFDSSIFFGSYTFSYVLDDVFNDTVYFRNWHDGQSLEFFLSFTDFDFSEISNPTINNLIRPNLIFSGLDIVKHRCICPLLNDMNKILGEFL